MLLAERNNPYSLTADLKTESSCSGELCHIFTRGQPVKLYAKFFYCLVP